MPEFLPFFGLQYYSVLHIIHFCFFECNLSSCNLRPLILYWVKKCKKLNELEGKEQYRVEISNRFTALEYLDAELDINRAWET
jgi:hypothetical protein